MKSIKESYHRYLRYFLSKDDSSATVYDRYMALAYAVRSEMVDGWIKTQNYYHDSHIKRVYFLSMEYTLGKMLRQNIINTGLEDELADTAQDLGFSLDQIFDREDDFELGSGTKGYISGCMQESMATLGLPAIGYGLRYDYSFFRQKIAGGWQVEQPFDWLHKGHPWEILRPEYACRVRFNGTSESRGTDTTTAAHSWANTDDVMAIPSDVAMPGYGRQNVNTLRLWSARPAEEFLPDYANHKDYIRACEDISLLGRITKVLYPEEDVLRVTQQRIRQQFFFISATLQDILRRYKAHNSNIDELADRVVIQLEGSRCAVAIPEMMRLLVDEENVAWERAWEITQRVFTYTSHAVMPDNLEMWPVYLVNQLFPRHLEIIYEINQHFMDTLPSKGVTSVEDIRDLSVIEEGEVKRVKMANLAVLGSSHINGVSVDQTIALAKRVFPKLTGHGVIKPFAISCGASHRRWLLGENSLATNLISNVIGRQWITRPDELQKLEAYSQDAAFLAKWDEVKQLAKQRLLISVRKYVDFDFAPDALFDVQCRKIHPGKRQVLHLLGILCRYLRRRNGGAAGVKRLHIFAGKAMPSDHLAKQVIALINVVGRVVNGDSAVRDTMGVLFVPDYGMTWAGKIIPAVELAENIATPGMEACGTTAFKMAFNGAVPIISRTGTNCELAERVGPENSFVFGAPTRPEENGRQAGLAQAVAVNQELQGVLSFLEGVISSTEAEGIHPLLYSLRDSDAYAILRDFDSYMARQDEVDRAYGDRGRWNRMSVVNCARSGFFSIDNTVAEYARAVWKVRSIDI